MGLDDHRPLWPALLIAAALGAAGARVLHVSGPLSDSDRSRWATVKALLDDGQFSIGRREPRGAGYEDVGVIADPAYKSVDVVLDPNRLLFYSSKPPLLPALVAVQCRALGLSLDTPDHVRSAVRVTLVVWSLLPILVFLLAVSHLVRGDPWLMALAGFGTFVTSFAPGLNNHLPSAAACALAIVAVAKVFRGDVPQGDRRLRWFLLAGVAAGFAATQELPALFLLGAVVAVLAMRDARRALGLALPTALCVLALALAVNAAAYGGQLFPTFPREWYRVAGSYWSNPTGIDVPDRSVFPYLFHFLVGHHGVFSLTPPFALALVAGARALGTRRVAMVWAGGLVVLVVGRALSQPADLPITVALIPAGVAAMVALWVPWRWWRAPALDVDVVIGRLSMSITLVVLGFYAAETTNYGGVSMGPRWLILLTPLWIAAMAPVVRELSGSPRGRALLVAMLGWAVLSATPSQQNPWVHPWLYGG